MESEPSPEASHEGTQHRPVSSLILVNADLCLPLGFSRILYFRLFTTVVLGVL